jgi:hypothetical protein
VGALPPNWCVVGRPSKEVRHILALRVVDSYEVDIPDMHVGSAQACLNGTCRKRDCVLDAIQPLLFNGSEYLAIANESGGSVVICGVDAKD